LSEAQLFPNKDTVLCVSLSARPGEFGMTVHNAAYRALGLNYLYKALSVTDLEGALAGVRALGIRGCSLSMPFKEQSLPLLDELDPAAESIGAVNTVVNESGRLVGYNTDAHGAQVVLAGLNLPTESRVLILGGGGVARAVLYALRSLGYLDIAISNRSPGRLSSWMGTPAPITVLWAARDQFPADLIINATPVGMAPDIGLSPIGEDAIHRAQGVMDVVVTQLKTHFISSALKAGMAVASGSEMSLHQAARQFELYTGHAAPLEAMERAASNFLSKAG
jgi:shikimate dehydrogenase